MKRNGGTKMTARALAALAGFAAVLGAVRLGTAQECVQTYFYDEAGRLAAVATAQAGTNSAVGFAYDANGNRTNTVAAAPGDRSLDSNGDGLADLDELRYFGTLNVDGNADTDGDGLTTEQELSRGSHPFLTNTDNDPCDDYEEYVADTDPNSATSYFCIASAVVEANPLVRVSFLSSTQRFYTLFFRDSLTGGAWTNVPGQGPRRGIGTGDSMSDTNAAPTKFYRVQVRIDPP